MSKINNTGSIKTSLTELGLTISDDCGVEVEYKANHALVDVDAVFKSHNWEQTFLGSVGVNADTGKKMIQAAYDNPAFGGGHAVLHLNDTGEVYYVTLSFHRNYHD